jgi:hypothetical protein
MLARVANLWVLRQNQVCDESAFGPDGVETRASTSTHLNSVRLPLTTRLAMAICMPVLVNRPQGGFAFAGGRGNNPHGGPSDGGRG